MAQIRSQPVEAASPRAPSQALWDAMTPDERVRAVLALPALVPVEEHVSEGDAYRRAKSGAASALESFFRRIGRNVYVSSDLAVFYPDEPRIVPDLMVVLDVDPHDRTKWMVSAERKGLDLLIAMNGPSGGLQEHDRVVERYASLGITECFLYDGARRRLRGYRLPKPGAGAYEPIAPVEGRLPSQVLGLDLMLERSKIRFFCGTAMLPEPEEVIARLGNMLNEAMVLKEDAERSADDEVRRAEAIDRRSQEAIRRVDEAVRRAEVEALRAEEALQRAESLEHKLAEALSELHKLKGWE